MKASRPFLLVGLLFGCTGCMTVLTQIRLTDDVTFEPVIESSPRIHQFVLLMSLTEEPVFVYAGSRTLFRWYGTARKTGDVGDVTIMTLDFPFCLAADTVLLPWTLCQYLYFHAG